MPERLARGYWIRLQRTLRRIARGHGTAHEIALGAAIGIFIGMTPTIGLQMVIAAAIATIIGANRLSAVLPVWISNPATMFWIYGTNYTLGRLIVGGPTLQTFLDKFGAVHKQSGFFAAMQYMLSLGISIQLPLWLGSLLLGTVLAIPTYYGTLYGVEAFRLRLVKRREARAERVTLVLAKRAEEKDEENAEAPQAQEAEETAAEIEPVHDK